MRLFKLFVIPILLPLGYLLLLSYPYLSSKINRYDSLGLLSVVEEKSVNLQKTLSPQRATDQFDNHLFKGEKVTSKIKATENNLGIILVRFVRFGKVSDKVVFRLKEEGEDLPAGRQGEWYYENIYKADQFQDNEYFTFGFPPAEASKDKIYVFELESLTGTYKNGIGISMTEPQVAFVYKYTLADLKNYNALSSFVSKKLVYAANNVNFLQNKPLLAAYILSIIFVVFIKNKRTKFLDVFKFLLLFIKTPIEALKLVFNVVWHNYIGQIEKKIVKFSNKTTRWFSSTKFYVLFFNTNTKKRIIIGLLILLLAFTYRFSSTLINPSHPWVGSYQTTFFYAGLGGQGDYDQFIRTATCAVTTFCSAILGQNFLFEASILGMFFKIFGFTGALKAYLYFMLILSSIVATLPYFLLSRKSWISIGGIIGSLFLATSDFLTHISLNFPPDNGSLFTFSMFFIVYLLTLNIGTIRWLLFFGLMGTIDGLNKALFLINDLAAFALFVPVFFYEKVKGANGSLFKKKNIKILFLSSLPLLVFLIIYIGWEYIVYIKFSAYYFLRGLLQSGGSSYVSYTSFSDSPSTGNIVLGFLYLGVQAIIMVKHLIEYAGLQTIFLAPIFFGLLFFTFIKIEQREVVKRFILLSVFSAFLIVLLTLVANNYYRIHEIFNGDYIYAWIDQTYIGIFLFLEVIALFILSFKYSAVKLSLPIIPYIIMLIIMAKNAPFARLHTHVVAWSIILFAFLIEWIIISAKKYSTKASIVLGFLIFVPFILLYLSPKLITAVNQINTGIAFSWNEVRYLKWVEESLPANAIILAGGKSDLVTVAENIKRPIVYSTLWSAAVLIKPKEIPGVKATDFHALSVLKINEIPGVRPDDFSIVRELTNKDNFKKNKYIILEDDIYVWRDRVTGVVDNLFSPSLTTLRAEDYSIKVYKFNPTLKKAIYELNLRDTSVD